MVLSSLKSTLNRWGVEIIPEDFNPLEMKDNPEKTLFVIPYCVKPIDCPMDRWSERCSKTCSKCDMSSLLKSLDELGLDYYIIIRDPDLIHFLGEEKDRYRYVVGVSCDLAKTKFKDYVGSDLGYKGFAIPLLGRTCSDKDEYELAEAGRKKGQTYLNLEAIDLILKIFRGEIS